MAKDIAALQSKVVDLEEAKTKVASLEEINHAARLEIEKLKSDLAAREEQLKLRDQQLQKLQEENQQHLATAKKLTLDFEETVKRMEETPAQNVVQKVISGYKADPHTYEEFQIVLAPALRSGYTLGVDEAKPADLVITTLPNHRLYDKKAGDLYIKRYEEYKAGVDIISKYQRKTPGQPSSQPAQPSDKSLPPS